MRLPSNHSISCPEGPGGNRASGVWQGDNKEWQTSRCHFNIRLPGCRTLRVKVIKAVNTILLVSGSDRDTEQLGPHVTVWMPRWQLSVVPSRESEQQLSSSCNQHDFMVQTRTPVTMAVSHSLRFSWYSVPPNFCLSHQSEWTLSSLTWTSY